ncbi:hypothetical protein KO524_07770 [Flavobacterium sp. NKUCC04_CG]|nr:hypothetical protein [Flavobacterium sp. NKUCC04_CG]
MPTHYYEYLPFGEMMVEHNNSNFDNIYKFNAKELDEKTGYYYYGARYYNPRTSLFLSVDPLAEQTMEPYSYVGNNPINFTDPTGMSKEGSDGWYEDERGTITHSPTINSQKDLDDKNMKGSFIDKSFVGIDGDNRNYDFKENGTVGRRSKDERIERGTKVLTVDRVETIVNETISRNNLAPIVISAVAISQSDSPIPGPADIFALGMLYSAITNMFTSTETEQIYTLHFAKSKKGKLSERQEEVQHNQAGNGKLTGAKKTTHQKRRPGDMGEKKRQNTSGKGKKWKQR